MQALQPFRRNSRITQKAPYRASVWSVMFWATVETWPCNMADSGIVPTPLVNMKGKVTKTQRFIVFGDYTLMKHNFENCIPFLPLAPPISYSLDL